MRRLPSLLALLAATAMLMSVAFAEHRPAVFFDTNSYDVMGQDLIQTVRDWPASNHNKAAAHLTIGDRPAPADILINNQSEGARSPFYGAFMHGVWRFATLWGVAAVQCLVTAWVVYLLWRTLAPRAPLWSYPALIAAVTLGSSISFFTTFAMPDIFAGVGGVAMVLILAQGDRLRRAEIVGLWAVCAYSLATHKSHLATGLLTAVGGGLLLRILGLRTRTLGPRVLAVLGAALVAAVAGAAFDHVYENRTGHRLAHPPFLMARVLADGPGRRYLRAVCPAPGQGGVPPYTLCGFQRNMSNSVNLILWSDSPTTGVFNYSSRDQRDGMEAEETRFVVGAVTFDPLGQVTASLRNWARQLAAFKVDDPLGDPATYLTGPYWPTTSLPKLIPHPEACSSPGPCRPPFDEGVLARWHGTVLAASLLFLVWRLCRKDMRQALWSRGLKAGQEPARVAATVLLLAVVVLANAAVCGMLAGPFPRYEARLIWLLPVAASLVALALPARVMRRRRDA